MLNSCLMLELSDFPRKTNGLNLDLMRGRSLNVAWHNSVCKDMDAENTDWHDSLPHYQPPCSYAFHAFSWMSFCPCQCLSVDDHNIYKIVSQHATHPGCILLMFFFFFLYLHFCHKLKVCSHKYYRGWIVLTLVMSSFLFFTWHLIRLVSFLLQIPKMGMKRKETVGKMYFKFLPHESPGTGKKTMVWRHDKNLINDCIGSFINEYWIFSVGQKSVADGQECTAAQDEARFPFKYWQVSSSNHLHMPLPFASSQNKSTSQCWHQREKWSQKSVDVTTAPACFITNTLIFTVFSVCWGRSSANSMWRTSSVNFAKPRQKSWPAPRGVMSNFALHSQ